MVYCKTFLNNESLTYANPKRRKEEGIAFCNRWSWRCLAKSKTVRLVNSRLNTQTFLKYFVLVLPVCLIKSKQKGIDMLRLPWLKNGISSQMLKLPHVGAVKLGKMLTGAVKLEHEWPTFYCFKIISRKAFRDNYVTCSIINKINQLESVTVYTNKIVSVERLQ